MAQTKKKTEEKSIPKRLQGTVVSLSSENTVLVRVERKFSHPLYKKIIAQHKKYTVHNEIEDIKVGDIVTIEEGKPVSKRKTFYLIKKGN